MLCSGLRPDNESMRTLILHLISIMILSGGASVMADDNQKCLEAMGGRLEILDNKIKSNSVKTVNQSKDGETVYLNGKITFEMAAEFKQKVSALGSKVKYLVINSPGGNVGAGQEIADWVFERGSNLTVSVPPNGICASMCTHILACAGNTSADQSALFMYHPAAMNSEGKAGLEALLKKGPMADMAGDILAGLVTRSLNKNKCAREYQSQGARRLTAATSNGLEVCFSASAIDQKYPGLIVHTPKTGNGMLDSAPRR